MAVTAEIKTGERRVIEFFISPFIKYVGESLTLR
jgi:hemolysin D